MEEFLVKMHDYDYVMNKLWNTINTYKSKYPDLNLLADFINNLNKAEHTTFSYLNAICTYSDKLAHTSYVIRFLHYRLEREVQDFRRNEFVQEKYPYYLEFPGSDV
ncbi:hypothetical protein [Adhaeribacter aquaticus]|uniref:hypothetical protein n=1 Tax=Adhaeribacter aquaticus TaxID=299567 RepID=UPI00040C4721|nr:hypothetical protein [Adhaeribacter aquaticus]